jgi:cobalamin biosynthesis Mg chelatase CobN
VTATAERNGEITRTDIESKLREIRGEVNEVGESARSIGVIVGAVAVVAVVGVVYLFGRRRGRKEKTVVEIRRV